MLEATIAKNLRHFTLEMSVTCPAGEILAVVGPSGSGKTSLVRCLAGLEKIDVGRISVAGRAWADTTRGIFLPPRSRRLGYVFQEYTLLPHLSVEKNVRFAAVEPERVGELLALLDIGHLAAHKPNAISGGERQRAALAQALARKPGLLLLDEPFSSLDYLIRRKLQRRMIELKKRLDIPIVLVTHDIEEACLLGDRVVAINTGRRDDDWLREARRELGIPDHCTTRAPSPYTGKVLPLNGALRFPGA